MREKKKSITVFQICDQSEMDIYIYIYLLFLQTKHEYSIIYSICQYIFYILSCGPNLMDII